MKPFADDEVDDAPVEDEDEKAENESRLYLAGSIETFADDEVDEKNVEEKKPIIKVVFTFPEAWSPLQMMR
jgi:hypothetical protein